MQTHNRDKSRRSQDRSFINSLSHGLAVLEAVAESESDIPLASLAKRVCLKKTNTWRLAHTLVSLGYLRQDAGTRRFSPSPRVLALGYAYFDRLDLRQLAAPFLQDLSARVREMVNLAILDADDLVFVDRIKSSQIVNVNLHPGSRLTLYNTALGRVLISEMPQVWLRQYISRLDGDPKAVKYIQSKGKKLLKMLSDIRERGYGLSDNERIEGLRSVASPIRDKTSKVVAAINILVPATRVSALQLRQTYVSELMETATKISAALGFRVPLGANRL
jgi:IclR family pca regulon transcriptional regulator